MNRSTTKTLAVLPIAFVFLAVVISANGDNEAEAGYGRSGSLPQVIEYETLDVLSLNIAHGRGRSLNQLLVSEDQHRKNLDEISSMLLASGVQVLALQEADAPSLWSGRFDHVAYLAGETDFGSFVHGYHADSWLFSYGTALMSRYAMSAMQSHPFQSSWPTATKGFVLANVLWRKGDDAGTAHPVTLASIHLDFSRESVRKSQIEELVRELRGVETPLVILGDFNADWSSVDSPLRELANELALRPFEPEATGIGTYKVSERLDWILISHELEFVEYSVLPELVSDHLAVQAKIRWNSDG